MSPAATSIAQFIRREEPAILAEWERSVRPILPAGLDRPSLLDHVPELLLRIAERLEAPDGQARHELELLTEDHALSRLEGGAGLEAVIGEYVELRRSIFRLWEREVGPLAGEAARIDRTLDEALLEAVTRYTRAHDRTLGAVDRLSMLGLDCPGLEAFLPRLLRSFTGHSRAVDFAAIYLEEGGALRLRAEVGLPLGARELGDRFVAQVARERQPVGVSARTASHGRACPEGIQSVYGVPLLHEDAVIGVAWIGSRTAAEFSPADQQLLRVLAARATTLIVQHQLVEAERAARAEAERTTALLDTVLRTAPVGLAFLDAELRYVRINDDLARLNGLPAADHVGRSLHEVVPDVAPFVEPALRRVLDIGEALVGLELAVEAPGVPGDVRHWMASFYPIRPPGAPGPGLVGCVVVDVTERRRREEERRRQAQHASLRADVSAAFTARGPVEEALRGCVEAIVRHLGAAFARVWLFDPAEGVLVLKASAGLYTHLDGPHARVPLGALKIGRIALERRPHLTNRVLDDEWISDKQWARREGMVAFAGHPLVVEDRLLGVVASFSRQPFADDTLEALGSVAGLVAQNLERRRVEGELSRLAWEQQFLARASVTLAGSLDADETYARTARLVVESLAEWCLLDIACEGDPPLRQVAAAHVDPARAPVAAELSRRLPARQDAPHGVGRVLRTGKSEVWPEVDDLHWLAAALGVEHAGLLRELGARSYICAPILARGRVAAVLSVVSTHPTRRYGARDLALVEDLAGRVALAIDNARLYQEAERAVRAREELLRAVSHDLRNPLAAISLGVTTLQKELPEAEVRPRMRAAAIQRAAARATRLIEDLLGVAAIETGKLALRRAVHPATELVEEAAELHRPLAAERSIDVVTEAAPDAGPVLCDRDQVARVLSNLLGNAIRFSAAGTRIVLRARPREDQVELAVVDQGPGIPPDQLEHLFERGYQAAPAGRRDGLGLGLTIAKGLVEAQGGRIGVRSAPGQGSTFWFTLPRAA